MKKTPTPPVIFLTLLLFFAPFLMQPAQGQILKNLQKKAKEKAKEQVEGATGKSGRDAKHDAATKSKEVTQLRSELEMSLKHIESNLAQKKYDMTDMHIGKAQNAIDELKEHQAPTGDYEDRLKGLKTDYEQATEGMMDAEEQKEADFLYVKEAKWALSPLHNMMDPPVKGMMANKNKAQSFYDNCANIDYGAAKIRIKEIKAAYPEDFQEDYEMDDDYKEVCETFPAWFDKEVLPFMTKEANAAIEKAYKLKAQGTDRINDALETAQAALLTTQGVLLIKPGHEQTLKLRKDAQKAVDEIEAELGDLVYTSKIHKENAGKIIFAKAPVTIKEENPANFTSTFSADDYIYGMIYLKGTLIEQAQADKTVKTQVFVDENLVAEHEWGVWSDAKEKTYVDLEVIPDPDHVQTYGAIKYTQGLAQVSPREHQVKVVLTRVGSNALAEGEFTLDCSDGTAPLQAIAETLEEQQLEKVRMPQAAMENSTLGRSMMAAMRKHWPDETPLRAVITSDHWTMHYHALSGAILFRSIDAAVAFKTKAGDCKYFYLTFKQPYNGNGFGHTEYHSVGGHQVIKCTNVTK